MASKKCKFWSSIYSNMIVRMVFSKRTSKKKDIPNFDRNTILIAVVGSNPMTETKTAESRLANIENIPPSSTSSSRLSGTAPEAENRQ